jgi:hypothetical protein
VGDKSTNVWSHTWQLQKGFPQLFDAGFTVLQGAIGLIQREFVDS